ncbi:MAG: hypothetical protein HFH25_02930 [Lachnospiraceae bacterium]|nr:hypothetical protein [Lachnospiraceae bacterium]
MEKIPHLLLTRFNLAIHFGCEKKPGSKCPEAPWLNEEYLAGKFEIFEKWTYPSIQNQTDHIFKWIVLLRKDTPNKFKQKIENYAENMDNFEVWYLDDEESENFENIFISI